MLLDHLTRGTRGRKCLESELIHRKTGRNLGPAVLHLDVAGEHRHSPLGKPRLQGTEMKIQLTESLNALPMPRS